MSRRVAPPVEAPAFASILTSQDTYLNSVTSLSVVGSGGGGAYPANPSFSTISFPSTDFLTTGVIKYSGGLFFNDLGTPVLNDFILGTNNAGGAFPVSTNLFSINSPAGNSASLVLGAGDNANAYIIASLAGDVTPGAALNLVATGVNISSLNVSSINGAIPGTGSTVPANLNLSTLNVSSMITTSSITTTDLFNVAVLNGRPEVGNGLDIISAGNLNLTSSVDPTFGIYTSGAFLSTPALIVSSINSFEYPPANIAANSITLASSINITAAGIAAANPVIQTLGSTLGDFTNGVYYVNVIKYGTCKKTYLSGYIPSTNPNFFTTSLTIPSLVGLAGNWTSPCTVSVSIMVISPDGSSRSGYLTFQVVGVNTTEWTLSANQSLSAAPQVNLAFSIANQSSVDGPVLTVSNSAGPNTTRAAIYVSIEVTQVLTSP